VYNRNTYHRFYLAEQTVHEYFTNTRIVLSFVYSWSIRGWFSQQIINTTFYGRLLPNNLILLSILLLR